MAPDKEVQYEVPETWSKCVVNCSRGGNPNIARRVTENVLRGIGGTKLVEDGDDENEVVLKRRPEEPVEGRLALTLQLLRESQGAIIRFEE